jgi:hypothetical protein
VELWWSIFVQKFHIRARKIEPKRSLRDWFYCAVCSVTDRFDIQKRKKKKHQSSISYATVTLGVDGGNRSKSLIKNQCSSLCCKKHQESKTKALEEANVESLYKLFQRKLNRDPEKKDFLRICKRIKEHDCFCPEIPKETCEIDELIDWFAKNFKDYEVMIHSFNLKWNWMKNNHFFRVANIKERCGTRLTSKILNKNYASHKHRSIPQNIYF